MKMKFEICPRKAQYRFNMGLISKALLLTFLSVSHGLEDAPSLTCEATRPLLRQRFDESEYDITTNFLSNHESAAFSRQGNITVETVNNSTAPKKFNCFIDETIEESPVFEIINGTKLLSILKHNSSVTSRTQPATCKLILFYAPWCPFSAQAAPHLNALPRGFPMFKFYAIDAHANNSLTTLQGVMAIPSFYLFHNGKPAARYNETEYRVELFGNFITRYTGVQPIGVLNRTSADYLGPLPTSVVETTDHWLIIAWVVLVIAVIYWFTRSHIFWTLVECVRNTWREAEAQHLHVD